MIDEIGIEQLISAGPIPVLVLIAYILHKMDKRLEAVSSLDSTVRALIRKMAGLRGDEK